MSAENLAFDLTNIVYSIFTGLVAFVAFIGRKTFTNEKKIAVLETAIAHSNEQRTENNKNIHEMRTDIKTLLSSLHN